MSDEIKKEKLPVKEKTKHILEETRVVLPGTQALLGFQLTAFFTERFSNIPQSLQYLHVSSLACIAFGVILLMSPVAYHQIVESGDDTKRFNNYGRRVLVLTLMFVAIGMSLDAYVVVALTFNQHAAAFTAAAGVLITSYLLWFGYMLVKREEK